MRLAFATVPGMLGSHVKVWTAFSAQPAWEFFPYSTSWQGGASAAIGDVNNDGSLDICTASSWFGSFRSDGHVACFDIARRTMLLSFMAYPGSGAGANIAIGKFGGVTRIVTAPHDFGPNVRIWTPQGSSASLWRNFMAYPVANTGGLYIAAGNLDGDSSSDELVVAPTGNAPFTGPHVRVFSGASILYGTPTTSSDFLSTHPWYTGGVSVAVRDGKILTSPAVSFEYRPALGTDTNTYLGGIQYAYTLVVRIHQAVQEHTLSGNVTRTIAPYAGSESVPAWSIDPSQIPGPYNVYPTSGSGRWLGYFGLPNGVGYGQRLPLASFGTTGPAAGYFITGIQPAITTGSWEGHLGSLSRVLSGSFSSPWSYSPYSPAVTKVNVAAGSL